MGKNLTRLLPFLVLIVAIVILYVSNLHIAINLDWIKEKEQLLLDYRTAHPILAPLLFITIYTFSVCLMIPDSTILTILGGMVFSFPEAFIYSLFSEVVGAFGFFAIFSALFQIPFLRREKPLISKLQRQFRRHSASYLLFLRFSHILPFWATNLASAYFKIPYKTFIWTTLVGVIPLTLLLVNAGHSLPSLFQSNQEITIGQIFTPAVKIVLIVLGVLALTPVFFKKILSKKRWKI